MMVVQVQECKSNECRVKGATGIQTDISGRGSAAEREKAGDEDSPREGANVRLSAGRTCDRKVGGLANKLVHGEAIGIGVLAP